MEDDGALLRHWRAGDNRAGNELIQCHAPRIHAFFASKVDPDRVEELTQATFEVCLQSRAEIHEGASVRAYLLGIARRKLLQHYDEWRRRGSRFDPLVDSVAATGVSPSGRVALGEEQRLIARALARLPLDFQLTVELHYWEDLTVSEIATVLEVAAGTVKSRLARARVQLKQEIEALAESGAMLESLRPGLETWIASMRRRLEPR